MFRYRLRTLLILMAVGPPIIACAWFAPPNAIERYRQWQFERLIHLIQTKIVPVSTTLTGP
jgi:hypothetical protein